jgi:putative membrane protein
MLRLLLHWVLSAIAVWMMAQLVPGITLNGPRNALVAALVIGFINATVGLVLKVITFPLTLVTLGLFWFVINALMLELASALLAPGFQVRGFLPAFLGAIVLSVVKHGAESDCDALQGSTLIVEECSAIYGFGR